MTVEHPVEQIVSAVAAVQIIMLRNIERFVGVWSTYAGKLANSVVNVSVNKYVPVLKRTEVETIQNKLGVKFDGWLLDSGRELNPFDHLASVGKNAQVYFFFAFIRQN